MHLGVLVHKGIILAGNDVNNALEAIEQSLAAIPTDPCETAEINIVHVVTPPSCATDSLGSIHIEISGDTEPYLTTLSDQEFQHMIGNLSAGEYILNVVDAHNCMTSDSITITEPNMISIGEITGTTEVDVLQTYSYSVSDNANIVFHWSVTGGTILSGQGTHSVNVEWGSDNEGQVEVLAESESGCKSDTTKLGVIIQSTTSVTDQVASLISLYPNPAGDMLYVSTEKEVVVSVFDVTGQLKLTTRKTQIELSTLGRGTYFVNIKSAEFSMTKRIVKY